MDTLLSWLYPLEWVVANIMVAWHWLLTAVGLDSGSGVTWALSIVGLVVTIRAALIPLFVKQIKASRAMQVIAPDLKKIQDKYRGKKDQASREAMSRETMELYSKHKTNPFASCVPMLVQAPIFFALFRVLNYRLEGDLGSIGWLSDELLAEASEATLVGAKLSETFFSSEGSAAKILSAVLIVAMVATTFLTQRQLTRKNLPAAALEGPMAQQQKILMYALPFIFVITGPNFPVGVLIYWTTTNVWTMGQQFYVIRNNPTPGSEADRQHQERLAAKAARRAARRGEDPAVVVIEQEPVEEPKRSGQRQQPKRKGRGGSKPQSAAGGDQEKDNS